MLASRTWVPLIALVVAGTLALPTTPVAATASRGAARTSPHPAAAVAQHIDLLRWHGTTLKNGRFESARYHKRVVLIGRDPARLHYRDPHGQGPAVVYERGRWYSPWHGSGFRFTELIASWNADAPVGTFIDVSVRGRSSAGRLSSWDSLGRWAAHDVNFHRMSLGSQSDDLGAVNIDTWAVKPAAGLPRWQLRVSLFRKAGTHKSPALRRIGAMSSRLPSGTLPTSTPRPGGAIDLRVPRYSQEIHAGEYPQWNGGGEAWCSPTSTAMVLGYWDSGPTPRQYAWVDHSYRQPWVDYAARFTYASGYDGTGDWPFNTAYAARFGLDAWVTRLRSLREAQTYINNGVPLVASIAFGPGELDGAPINSTNGHLLVIRGFTASGKVIVNDPAAAKAAGVRRIYKRGQFERAWVGATGGVVYVIQPPRSPIPIPARPGSSR